MENTPNLERLRQLAEHLLHGQLGHPIFDFNQYNCSALKTLVYECGTNGCAIGECPIVWPKDWHFDVYGEPVIFGDENAEDSGLKWFNLTGQQYAHLFLPTSQSVDLAEDYQFLKRTATKEQVANNILDFCQKIENELTGSN